MAVAGGRLAHSPVTPASAVRRVHALTYADLGDSLAAQARSDEAVAAWFQALPLMEGMASDRSRKAITALRSPSPSTGAAECPEPPSSPVAHAKHWPKLPTNRPTKGHKP